MVSIINELLYRPITKSSQPIVRGSESIGPVCSALEAAGLLQPMEPLSQYYCQGCYRLCRQRVFSKRTKGGVLKRFYRCPKNKYSAEPRTFLEPYSLNQWKVDFPALIVGLAKAMELSSNVYENLLGLSWKLGERNGREFFFFIDVDAFRVREIMREFASRRSAVLFMRCDHMAEVIRSMLDNTYLLAEEYVTITDDAKIVVDMDGIDRMIGGFTPPVDEKARYEFRRQGNRWIIRYEDEEQFPPDQLGFRHIAALLAKPGESIDAYELRRLVSKRVIPPADTLSKTEYVVDAQYLKRVQERHRQLQSDLKKSENDGSVQEEMRKEMDQLLKYITHHRRKSNANELENARQSVRKTYSASLKFFEKKMPKFFDYLTKTIEVGKTCNYRPVRKIEWNL